jgi:hypothetical protein
MLKGILLLKKIEVGGRNRNHFARSLWQTSHPKIAQGA